MYKCNYCKRFLKEKYKNCPGCGASSFSKVASFNEQVKKTPPVGGYKIKVTNFKYQKKLLIIPAVIIIFILIIFIIPFTSAFGSIGIDFLNEDYGWFGIPFILFGIVALISISKTILSIWNKQKKDINKVDKDIDKIKHLSTHGMLIKNLPYELKLDKKSSVSKPIYRIKVLYEIEKGRTLSLLSEPKYLTTLGRENGTVDLLIDPNDYSNYFIDFEIY